MGDIYRHIALCKRGKAADRYGNCNEFVKYLIDDPQYLELLLDVILIPMAKGHSNFSSTNQTSCAGTLLIALAKPNGMPQLVQIPDVCCAITTSCLCCSVFKSASALLYFEHGVSRTCSDCRFSQYGLLAKEIQHTLESIGHHIYLDVYMQQMIGELSTEFQKLISYPHQHDFMLMLCYCCNKKILHLE